MTRTNWLLSSLVLWGIAAATTVACTQTASDDASTLPASLISNPEIDTIRTATERFRDLDVALKDGYILDPMNLCFAAPMEGYPKQLGSQGVHYFRPDMLGITETTLPIKGTGTHTDYTRPGVLLYEPQADGGMELVAIENLVFADAWHATSKGPPEFLGNQFYRMIDNPATADVDEAHMFMPHYELHMWLYRENPNGMFAQFNPNVTCAHHKEVGHSTH